MSILGFRNILILTCEHFPAPLYTVHQEDTSVFMYLLYQRHLEQLQVPSTAGTIQKFRAFHKQ